MTREALRAGLNEDAISQAMLETRGDIFLTAAYCGCTVRELDAYIRASSNLQAFAGAIGRVKCDADYDRLSTEQFEERLDVLTRAYRLEALDVIHDLATMPFDNAAMAEVKLKAAVQLRGVGETVSKSNGQDAILAELNQLYHTSAQRIKSVRISQIEFQTEPQAIEVL